MIFSLCFRNLFRNIRRTIAIFLTVALGTGALLSFQGFIQGVLTEYSRSTIHAHHGDGQLNTKGYRETVYQKPWDHWIENWREVRASLYENPGVDRVFPRVSIGGMLFHGSVSITGQGQGIDAREEGDFFDALNIEEGEQLFSQGNGILLGKGLAKALRAKPGDKISLYTKSTAGHIVNTKLEVVGVFHTGNSDFDNRVFRIQLDVAQDLLDTDKVESISLGLIDHSYWPTVAGAMSERFPELEASSFAELDKVYYQNSVDWLQTQFYVVQLIILSIVLLGIFNTISTSILERKQEIGNLRANGESAWDVMKLILCEGALLGLVGSLIGIGLTLLIAKGVLHKQVLMPPGPGSTRQFFLTFYFTTNMAIESIALSTLSALAASFLAGLKVARLPIAKALRSY
jgi:putative ABC transport system permease protein